MQRASLDTQTVVWLEHSRSFTHFIVPLGHHDSCQYPPMHTCPARPVLLLLLHSIKQYPRRDTCLAFFVGTFLILFLFLCAVSCCPAQVHIWKEMSPFQDPGCCSPSDEKKGQQEFESKHKRQRKSSQRMSPLRVRWGERRKGVVLRTVLAVMSQRVGSQSKRTKGPSSFLFLKTAAWLCPCPCTCGVCGEEIKQSDSITARMSSSSSSRTSSAHFARPSFSARKAKIEAATRQRVSPMNMLSVCQMGCSKCSWVLGSGLSQFLTQAMSWSKIEGWQNSEA